MNTTTNRHRLLRLVLKLDQSGSSAYIPIALVTGPVLAFFGPEGALRWFILISVSGFGLWLGLLGIAMAVGLSQVLVRGDTFDDEWWSSLLKIQPRSAGTPGRGAGRSS